MAAALAPLQMCTGVPPAKSSTPISPRNPPPQTACARGAYTNVAHSTTNGGTLASRPRSQKPPTAIAPTVAQKRSWNSETRSAGRAPTGWARTPRWKRWVRGFPNRAPPSANASE